MICTAFYMSDRRGGRGTLSVTAADGGGPKLYAEDLNCDSITSSAASVVCFGASALSGRYINWNRQSFKGDVLPYSLRTVKSETHAQSALSQSHSY